MARTSKFAPASSSPDNDHDPPRLMGQEISKGRTPCWHPRGLREREAAYYVGLSPSTFRRETDAGRLPGPVSLTPGRQVWLREHLDAYLDRAAGLRVTKAWIDPYETAFDAPH